MIASFLVAVPTGIKILNWLATLWRGNISFDTPMLFALGLISLFVIGGLTGIFVAAYPVDWQLHDTYFVVAHFHYTLFGGAMFGIFAGLYYWWPKMFGRRLDERLGKWHFWLMFAGFNLAFMPQHFLGLLGMPRRIYTYSEGGAWEIYNRLSTIGAFLMGVAILIFFWNALRYAPLPAGRQRPLGGEHARVVCDVAPAPRELDGAAAVRLERAAACVTYGYASRRRAVASPWVRLLSLWAAAAVLLAVVSGAGELGAAHDGLAALALATARGPRGRRVVPPSPGASVRGGCARPLRRRGASSRRAASTWRWQRARWPRRSSSPRSSTASAGCRSARRGTTSRSRSRGSCPFCSSPASAASWRAPAGCRPGRSPSPRCSASLLPAAVRARSTTCSTGTSTGSWGSGRGSARWRRTASPPHTRSSSGSPCRRSPSRCSRAP